MIQREEKEQRDTEEGERTRKKKKVIENTDPRPCPLDLADKGNEALPHWYDTVITPQHYTYPVLGNILIIDDYENSDIVNIVLRGL